jgi:hypothetical protein
MGLTGDDYHSHRAAHEDGPSGGVRYVEGPDESLWRG